MQDINNFCGGQLLPEGNTMHCLMGVAAKGFRMQPPRQLNPQCMRAITQAVQIANPADTARGSAPIDRILYSDCKSVIDTKCTSKEGISSQHDVLACLMTVRVWV